LSKELVANLPKVGNGEENKIEQEIIQGMLQSTSVKRGRGLEGGKIPLCPYSLHRKSKVCH